MAFDWKDYFSLAKDLAGMTAHPLSEAAQRSAVSRAYYSLFCSARNWSETHLGFRRSQSHKDHTMLRDHLKKHNQVDLADILEDLRKWRNRCDYDDQIPNLDNLTRDALKRTKEGFQILLDLSQQLGANNPKGGPHGQKAY